MGCDDNELITSISTQYIDSVFSHWIFEQQQEKEIHCNAIILLIGGHP